MCFFTQLLVYQIVIAGMIIVKYSLHVWYFDVQFLPVDVPLQIKDYDN